MFRRKKPSFDQVKTPSLSTDAEPDSAETATAVAPAPRSFAGPGPLARPVPPVRPDLPRRMIDIPGPNRKPADSEGKKLIVGRDISLNGAITACDRLVVEGTVEANLSDAGAIEIAETGLFKGNAEVDEAEIAGRFEGGLMVRKRLTIRATGRVHGTVRYASIVIEAGGEVDGTVEVIPTAAQD